MGVIDHPPLTPPVKGGVRGDMQKILFGTAGVPRSARASDTISGLKRIKALGLDAMELEFVRGVYMKPFMARQVRQVKESLGLKLTVHAPYFINLNAREAYKLSASIRRILDSAYMGFLCGAESVTFHPAFYLGQPAKQVYQAVKKQMQKMLNQLNKEKIDVTLKPELTGKPSQFGSLEELTRLARELRGIGFCLDISHLHARTAGACNTYEEFASVWKTIKKRLGQPALNDMHLHLSGIKYTAKGEREHLNLRQSDFNYKDFVKSLRDFKVGGILICESPNLEGDALLLKKNYQRI